jgi:predicted AAA+ superfamily ATPase
MQEAHLICKIEYFDIRGKKILKTSPKYYAGDLGILSYSQDFKNINYGYKLENLVYLELLKRYDKVYTHISKQGIEVDFLCYKNGEITYFQVTQNLIDESESNSN